MSMEQRIQKLEQHLSIESPVLLEVIGSYRKVDAVGRRLGILTEDESFVSQISWWPLISILGTFSSGKSSFINSYVGASVQQTGNQAVDDKFTVVCYGDGDDVVTLPGLALDADPRFPFFNISQEINRVESGEGDRIDSYLQLKATNSEQVRGKILIDSPGFDADAQRDSVLRIADHIMEMSDLVLVFFDARHPEPGAMRDTLKHLVEAVKGRTDVEKFVFILNQIDVTANEDNLEDVIGAWQRALSQSGLIGGRFYAIYNPQVAGDIANVDVAERFKRKNHKDLQAIKQRMDSVSVERSYRIAHALEAVVDNIRTTWIQDIKQQLSKWRRKVVVSELFVWSVIMALTVWGMNHAGYWQMSPLDWPLVKIMLNSSVMGVSMMVSFFVMIAVIHFWLRNTWANRQERQLLQDDCTQLSRAFKKNTVFYRPMFAKNPRGWTKRTQRLLDSVLTEGKEAIQKMNDVHANPSGLQDEAIADMPQNTNDSSSVDENTQQVKDPETESKTV